MRPRGWRGKGHASESRYNTAPPRRRLENARRRDPHLLEHCRLIRRLDDAFGFVAVDVGQSHADGALVRGGGGQELARR